MLNDTEIRRRILEEGMIEKAVLDPVREAGGVKRISYGVSHTGYDMRLAGPVLVPRRGIVHDPKDPEIIKQAQWVPLRIDKNAHEAWVLIPPATMALAVSVERFNLPPDITAMVIGKSTLAREGIIINCTPMEPGWSGYLTIEIVNVHQQNAVRVYLNEGIGQAVFFQHERPSITYAEKKGKYQNQEPAPVFARM